MILVVITTCNQLEYTKLTIDSLKRTTEKFDVLVIDDFSQDDTISYLENEKRIRHKRIRQNYFSNM